MQTQVWLGAASVLRSTQAAKWVQSPFDKQGPVKTKKIYSKIEGLIIIKSKFLINLYG